METIDNPRNIEAAKRAAMKRCTLSNLDSITSSRNHRYKAIKVRLGRRMHQMYDQWKVTERKIKRQLDACLNGNRPYSFTCRFTGVNLLVICSFWFLFIDQLRLVYAPSTMDEEFAIVSL